MNTHKGNKKPWLAQQPVYLDRFCSRCPHCRAVNNADHIEGWVPRPSRPDIFMKCSARGLHYTLPACLEKRMDEPGAYSLIGLVPSFTGV